MKTNKRSMNDSDRMIQALRERGILSASFDDGQCKKKIVDLGITIPGGKNDCLLYGREGQVALYLFVYFRDPARSSDGRGFIGLRFDFARYRKNPLVPGCGPRKAFCLFSNAVAEMVGIDLRHCIWVAGDRSRN
ncbi:MAG: hypothetical protein ACREE6_17950 [Limisphaerales bacterium]